MRTIKKLKFGIPTGAIQKYTLKLFPLAGYEVKFDEESYRAQIDDPEIECLVTRPIEIAPFVEKGILDIGFSTEVAVLENKAKVIKICGFDYDVGRKAMVVLAVPENTNIRSIKDLKRKKIITRIPEITKEFLKKNKISAQVISSDIGVAPSNVVKVPSIADATVEFIVIADNIPIKTALREFNFKILKVLMENPTVIIANENALKDKWKRKKIENLAILLQGARLAQEYAGLMLHASNDMMQEVLKVLPSLKKPTVTRLRGENWFDVLTVAKKKDLRKIIPKLKKIGCTDIVEFPLNKVIV